MKYFLIGLLFPLNLYCQDLRFIQAHGSGQYFNPALSGVYNSSQFSYSARSQWPSLSSPMFTQLATYEHTVQGFGSLGGFLLHDSYGHGASSMSEVGITYARKIKLSRELALSIGISPILRYSRFNPNKFSFGDPIFPRSLYPSYFQSITQENQFGYDTNVGFLIFGRNFYFGASSRHLLAANISEKLSINASAGIQFILNTDVHMQFQLGALFTHQDYYNALTFMTTYQLAWAYAGGTYAVDGTYGLTAGINQQRFKIGYAYEVRSSVLTKATGAIHEIQLIIRPLQKGHVCFSRTIFSTHF